MNVFFDETVTDQNRHDVQFWELGCNHSYGLTSIYFYHGDFPVVDVGIRNKSKFKRKERDNVKFVTTFGIENREENCRPKVQIIEADPVVSKLQKTYCHKDGERRLVKNLRELGAHPSALLVRKQAIK